MLRLRRPTVHPCLACDHCRAHPVPCAQRDDMDRFYDAFRWCDASAVARSGPTRAMFPRPAGLRLRPSTDAVNVERPLAGKPGGAMPSAPVRAAARPRQSAPSTTWLLSCGAVAVPGELNGLTARALAEGEILGQEKLFVRRGCWATTYSVSRASPLWRNKAFERDVQQGDRASTLSRQLPHPNVRPYHGGKGETCDGTADRRVVARMRRSRPWRAPRARSSPGWACGSTRNGRSRRWRRRAARPAPPGACFCPPPPSTAPLPHAPASSRSWPATREVGAGLPRSRRDLRPQQRRRPARRRSRHRALAAGDHGRPSAGRPRHAPPALPADDQLAVLARRRAGRAAAPLFVPRARPRDRQAPGFALHRLRVAARAALRHGRGGRGRSPRPPLPRPRRLVLAGQPLQLGAEVCDGLLDAPGRDVVVEILPCPMGGTTAPASLAGGVVDAARRGAGWRRAGAGGRARHTLPRRRASGAEPPAQRRVPGRRARGVAGLAGRRAARPTRRPGLRLRTAPRAARRSSRCRPASSKGSPSW